MKACIMRKVPYRLPGTSRLLYAIVVAENEGLALLFLRKPDDNRSHALVIATENVADRVFVDVNANRFPLEQQDLADIGSKLEALGDGLSREEFMKFFQMDD